MVLSRIYLVWYSMIDVMQRNNSTFNTTSSKKRLSLFYVKCKVLPGFEPRSVESESTVITNYTIEPDAEEFQINIYIVYLFQHHFRNHDHNWNARCERIDSKFTVYNLQSTLETDTDADSNPGMYFLFSIFHIDAIAILHGRVCIVQAQLLLAIYASISTSLN
jgi:hypothetical protein